MLLEKREDQNPVTYINNLGFGMTVLHISAYFGQVEIIKWYHEDLHFEDINPLDSTGNYTPMLYAATFGKLNVVKYIEAVQGGYKVLVQFLMKHRFFSKKSTWQRSNLAEYGRNRSKMDFRAFM